MSGEANVAVAAQKPNWPKMVSIGFLAFSSSLPLALTIGTLQNWFTDQGLDLKAIGDVTLIGFAYTLKPLWAPLVDRFVPPFLDHRRGWIIVLQAILMALIATFAFYSPKTDAGFIFALACIVAVVSATQDIAIDAYRTEVMAPHERGLGSAFAVASGRVALLTAGGFTLIIAGRMGWKVAFLFLAALFIPLMLATLMAPTAPRFGGTRTLQESFVLPILDFLTRKDVLLWLAIVLGYKFGDAVAKGLISAFLQRELGFSLEEIGWINKVFGYIAIIAGGMTGGWLMLKMQLRPALLLFGILQAVTNVGYVLLATCAKSSVLFASVVAFENFTEGLGTAAFLALLTALTNQKFSAFQFALLSALSAIGRNLAGPISAHLSVILGWPLFFTSTIFMAVPALLLILVSKPAFERLETLNAPAP
jgi:MFS transporter, PAT family, beta-lactamase induction signal transducer AmpG